MELPRHTLPSPQAFATAALAGMGWGMQLEVLVADHLKNGTLVELVPGTPLDVPLHWQQARAASGVLEGLSRAVAEAARGALSGLMEPNGNSRIRQVVTAPTGLTSSCFRPGKGIS